MIFHISKNVIRNDRSVSACALFRLFMHGSILLQAGIHIPIQMV